MLLQRPPALDWILLLSTTVSPSFALFSAATTFADAVSRLLGYIASHGDISFAARGDRRPDILSDALPVTFSSLSSQDGSMATIVCLQ